MFFLVWKLLIISKFFSKKEKIIIN
jgi:hypothetical protein